MKPTQSSPIKDENNQEVPDIDCFTDASNPISIVQTYLTARYQFRYNNITNRIEYRLKSAGGEYQYLEDYQFNSILKDIKIQGIPCSKDTLLMILRSDYVQLYNPFKDYLNKLPKWDGRDYIGDLASSVTTTQPDHFSKCFKKWFVASVASILKDDTINHTALIFSGKQGIGKTTWFHTILPKEFQQFIHEGYIHTKDKEINVKIAECILILMDELENLSDKSMDGIKQLMTQKGTSMRRAYTVMSQYYSRIASFAGTVNKKHFLRDMTGNRRFLCFEVLNINLKHGINHKQLFAQAVALIESGFQYWFDEVETKELEQFNAEFRDISVEEEAFINIFEKCDKEEPGSQILTTTQITNILEQKTDYKKLSVQNLGRVLRDMKVERRNNENGAKGYVVRLKQQ